MEEIIREIREGANTPSAVGDEILFSDSRYRSIGFHNDLFHEIKSNQDIKTDANNAETNQEQDKSICFVDGGNVEIIRMPNLSVHLVRAAYVIYKNNKKISFKRTECKVISRFIAENNAYSIRCVPDILPEMAFSSMDKTLGNGTNRASISIMGDVARRFLEIKLAKEAILELNPKDIIVRDGTLQSSVTGEGIFLNELYQSASEKNIIVMSVAKSCSLLTKRGNSVISALQSIAPKGKWYYYPTAEISHPDHLAELFFARLHEKSKYVFRIEFYKKSRYNIEEIMNLLAENSRDAQLPGYPYGLVAVDRLAKVEETEAESYKVRIMAKLGQELENGINALNGHEWF